MDRRMCKKFEECEAPICPLDENSIENSFWLINESICSRADAPPWVRLQRRIAKKLRDKNPLEVGYFKARMLEMKPKVTSGMKGINYSKAKSQEEIKALEAAWIASKEARPQKPKKILTPEQKEELLKNLAKGRRKKTDLPKESE